MLVSPVDEVAVVPVEAEEVPHATGFSLANLLKQVVAI